MALIVKPAVEIRQGERVLYLTSFTAAEFATRNFFNVEELDPDTGRGYQRILETKRSNRMASYMMDMRREKKAFLPTSTFLATASAIDYDPERQTISFDTEKTGHFNVVDGQHRIRGLIQARKDMPSLADFPLPTVIAAGLDKLHQKLHFFLVNTTQKPVDQSVQQRIITQLQAKKDMGEKFALPKWLAKETAKDSHSIAMDIATFLNENENSPWYGRILMANQRRNERTTIKQDSFVKSVRKFLLAEGHLLSQSDMRETTRNERLGNYWVAVGEIFAGDDAAKSVAFKSTGVNFFNYVSERMFDWLSFSGDYTVPRIKECFGLAFKELSEEDFHLSNADWWRSGKGASGLNTSMFLKKAVKMSGAVDKARQKEQGLDSL